MSISPQIKPEEVQEACAKLLPKLIDMRRHLHANPELSFQEKETSAFVSQQLNALGIEHTTNIGGYGIHAHMQGGLAGDRKSRYAPTWTPCPYTKKTTALIKAKWTV